LKKLCKPTLNSKFDYSKLDKVARVYEKLRIPRTTEMLKASQSLGDMQLSRSNSSPADILKKEKEIKSDVEKYGTLPIMFKGAGYRYDKAVNDELHSLALSKL
jgi:hypothetical protein